MPQESLQLPLWSLEHRPNASGTETVQNEGALSLEGDERPNRSDVTETNAAVKSSSNAFFQPLLLACDAPLSTPLSKLPARAMSWHKISGPTSARLGGETPGQLKVDTLKSNPIRTCRNCALNSSQAGCTQNLRFDFSRLCPHHRRRPFSKYRQHEGEDARSAIRLT